MTRKIKATRLPVFLVESAGRISPVAQSLSGDNGLFDNRYIQAPALSNWHWLAAIDKREKIVVFLNCDRDKSTFVTHGFRQQMFVDFGKLEVPDQSRDFEVSIECEGNQFDCVAIPSADDLLRQDACDNALESVWEEARRILVKEGGVYVGVEKTTRGSTDRPWRERLQRLRSAQVRHLRKARFSEIQAFYLCETPSVPIHLVPRTARAVAAFENVMRAGLKYGFLRKAIIWTGLHQLLFRYRIIIAYP